MARTTISVSDDLKKKMDRVKEPVNWSAIAAEAFELKLGEIARKRKEKTMDNVIERLRASKIQRVNVVQRLGREAGRVWATNVAEYDELERTADIDTNDWFVGQPSAPYGWSDRLAFAILGTTQNDRDSRVAADFWEAAVGDSRDARLASDNFLEGFIDGATDVYREVASKI
jgi:hypothetical protein